MAFGIARLKSTVSGCCATIPIYGTTVPDKGQQGEIMAEAAEGKNNRLSASEVGKALRSGEPVTLRDGGSLSLIVTGKNAGKWLYQGRRAGNRTLVDLVCGYAPETGLSAARAKRDEYRLLLKQGINPNEQRRVELAEAKRKKQEAEKTFSVVAGEYFRIRKDMTEKTRQGDMGRVENHINPFYQEHSYCGHTPEGTSQADHRQAGGERSPYSGAACGRSHRKNFFLCR